MNCTKTQEREAYINWAATQIGLGREPYDLFATVPSSSVWLGKGDKRYSLEIDEAGMVTYCPCPHHSVSRLSCKHMLAYERWQLLL